MSSVYTNLAIMAFTILTANAFASAHEGGSSPGGGDMCEDRIKIVRDDIRTWIQAGESTGLSLPSGVALNLYNSGMLSQISNARVSCTTKKVLVGSAEKTCKNFIDTNRIPRILCNSDRFQRTNESDQYVLVHHEYAGLAGIEVSDADDSHYPISNQITGYLEDQLVKRLAIKSTGNRLSPNGMVKYGHAVDTGYGYYDVYMPMIKGSDGIYYPFGAVPKKCSNLACDHLDKTIKGVAEGICQSLGLSWNYSHDSTWSTITDGEMFVKGLFEAPQTQSHTWFASTEQKMVVINCENVHDSRRANAGPGSFVVRMKGGTIVIPINR